MARLDRDDVDLVVLDADAREDPAVDLVTAIRLRAPSVPILVVTPSLDKTFALRTLRAGAEDCLVKDDGLETALNRAVRHAVERTRYRARGDAARRKRLEDREINSLQALCGPVQSPVTERSLGGRPLMQLDPNLTRDLLLRYVELLDLAIEQRRVGKLEAYELRVDRLVDRLGAMNAGPRDLIELHKAAISGKVTESPSSLARAYVNEGRLLLLHIMGRLVSFYRAMSWGKLPPARARGPGQRSATEHNITPGTTQGNR
jgi:response regulator RpfG family c-di-GMP phosphodiesterase